MMMGGGPFEFEHAEVMCSCRAAGRPSGSVIGSASESEALDDAPVLPDAEVPQQIQLRRPYEEIGSTRCYLSRHYI
eukprot:scaffold3613_cov80-Skeletonema_marinoi.AAC.4